MYSHLTSFMLQKKGILRAGAERRHTDVDTDYTPRHQAPIRCCLMITSSSFHSPGDVGHIMWNSLHFKVSAV